MEPEEPVAVDLSDIERKVLAYGVGSWGGPARCSEALAVAMGFRDAQDVGKHGRRLESALIAGEALTAMDWRRVLVSTEIFFASDVLGCGREWSIVRGISDEETLRVLRGLQRKLPWRVTHLPEHLRPR
ncbi:hypothetical protein DFR70_108127 [Nocardia tenerifensis]|uniref:Uncharacterized protein n=1 Tax=Nocardia tenerifensis TaxID=228006 RepID=A0A318JXS8_9NOCA|nr:hypothetical protein [Nocardia tenerifensis]PXX61569.1 hypothetical protein DFR70_108127 [Nocardia tenerifensis]